MSVINTVRDSRKGQWTSKEDGIVSPSLVGARLTVPVVPPERYVLTAEVEPLEGNSQLCLGLIVGRHPCSVVVAAGPGANESGLERIDDKPFSDVINLSHQVFPNALMSRGKRSIVRSFVLPDAVVVTCDDRVVVQWRGDPRRLSLDHRFLPSNYSESDRSRLWLGTWDSKLLIRELNLKPMNDEQEKFVESQFLDASSKQ
jgi:hypothetical protein